MATAAAQLEAAAVGARAGAADADAAVAAAAEQPTTPARGAAGSVPRVKLEHAAITIQDRSGATLGPEESLSTVTVLAESPAAAVAAQAAKPAAKQQQKLSEEGLSAAAPDTPAQQAVRRRIRTRQAQRTV
jgi:hypothetical protein